MACLAECSGHWRGRRLRLSNSKVREGLVDTGGLEVVQLAGFVCETVTVPAGSTTLRCAPSRPAPVCLASICWATQPARYPTRPIRHECITV
jgi:hypothetical protein